MTMKTIGRWMMLVIIGLMAGCDELYRTTEGVGIIGQAGGYFVCYNETQCSGVEQ